MSIPNHLAICILMASLQNHATAIDSNAQEPNSSPYSAAYTVTQKLDYADMTLSFDTVRHIILIARTAAATPHDNPPLERITAGTQALQVSVFNGDIDAEIDTLPTPWDRLHYELEFTEGPVHRCAIWILAGEVDITATGPSRAAVEGLVQDIAQEMRGVQAKRTSFDVAASSHRAPTPILFERSTALPPSRMSQDDLRNLISRIRASCATINGAEGLAVRESLELGARGGQWSFATAFDLDALNTIPEVITSMSYSLQYASDAPINNVRLDISDWTRKMTVRGTREYSIKDLTATVSAQVNAYKVRIGGSQHRAMYGMILYGVLVCVLALLYVVRVPGNVKTVYALVSMGCILVLFVAPWESWLPGLAVYPQGGSWFTRNNPWLVVAGVILPVLAVFRPICKWMYRSIRQG